MICPRCGKALRTSPGAINSCGLYNCWMWAHNMAERDALLQEREPKYGSFKVQGAWAADMKNKMREVNGTRLHPSQWEALDLVMTKISRILHGDPNIKDSWDDIAGYAKLGSEACE